MSSIASNGSARMTASSRCRKLAIESLGDSRVRVTHVEEVHGLFAPVFALLMGALIERSQQAFNEGLRTRAES